MQRVQCPQRQTPARRLRGQEKHFVELLRRQGFEPPEQRGHGLADARGRLGQQPSDRQIFSKRVRCCLLGVAVSMGAMSGSVTV